MPMLNETQVKMLVDELRRITSPAVLKSDAEHQTDRQRASEIAEMLGCVDWEEVFEVFGKYGQSVPSQWEIPQKYSTNDTNLQPPY